MIYIGDLSVNDFEILQMFAEESENILEFGVGASTQIFRHFSKGSVTSLDTDQNWIERTKENMKLLGIREDVEFRDYYTFKPTGKYDLIFSDGADEFRLQFALDTWDSLMVNGVLIFHDTRRSKDIANVAEFIKAKSSEINTITINVGESNLTVIYKQEALLYENWNEIEGKAAWLSGYEPVNLDELKKMQDEEKEK